VVAEEELHELGNDEREPEGQQQLVGVSVMVDASQDEALHDHADRADDKGRDEERGPETKRALQRIGEIRTQHVERRVGEIEDPHHSEDERETRGDHEEKQAIDDAVEQRDDEGVHGLPSDDVRDARARQSGRCILQLACGGVAASVAENTFTGLKPMSVSSTLNFASLDTVDTTIGSNAWWSDARTLHSPIGVLIFVDSSALARVVVFSTPPSGFTRLSASPTMARPKAAWGSTNTGMCPVLAL